jgi:hypothetical protein
MSASSNPLASGGAGFRLSSLGGTIFFFYFLFPHFLSLAGPLSALQASALADTNAPLAALAHRIAPADHIIATNWAAAQFGDPGFGFSITGEKVKAIVKAVSAANRYSTQEHPDCEWDWQLRFYNGTNFLAAIYFAQDTFLTDGQCRDDTGILERAYRDACNREYVSRVYKDEDKDFADSKKADARAWLKSPLHTIPGEDKKKVLRYVNAFYAAGALKVFVADIDTRMNGKNPPTENAKYLCVVLPADEDTRREVFRVHWQAVREWGFDADDDVGQKYTWYPIDWHDLK